MANESQKRPGETPEIERLFAVLGTDANGDEGIVGISTLSGWLPLVFSNQETLDKVPLNTLEVIARASGESMSAVEFTRTRVVRKLT